MLALAALIYGVSKRTQITQITAQLPPSVFFDSPTVGRQLGLSGGNYSLLDGGMCEFCAARIRRLCGYRMVDNSVPDELLEQGV